MPVSIEPSKLVSHRAWMSGELDSREDSQSAKLEWKPQKFIMLSFAELYNSRLSGLHAFDNMDINH